MTLGVLEPEGMEVPCASTHPRLQRRRNTGVQGHHCLVKVATGGAASLPSASASMLSNWQMSPDLACNSQGCGPLPAV